ncbi:MAG: FtsQ-type POTRA domain-containing protein [Oscillospiraceae bacterium]|nr:FtsQ-type POTRA domain-containing protein [Oscillospiraceae bacterium]
MNTQGRKSPPVRRSGRSDAGKRRPGSGVGSRLLIMAAIVAAVIFGVAIFFKVNTVEVQGNAIYSAEEIRSASGIQKGDNLFTLNKEAAAGSIKASLPYVETVSIIRFLPDKIVIEVKESDATFAVTTDTNTTWLINSVGKALEQISDSAPDSALTAEPTAPDAEAPVEEPAEQPVENTDSENAGEDEAQQPSENPDVASGEQTQQPSDTADTAGSDTAAEASAADNSAIQADGKRIPRILGVTVNSPTVGSVVTATNPASLNAALAVIAELDGTGLLDHIVSINTEKEYDIVLQYDGRYEIRLGGTEELSYKIDYLTVILSKLSDFQAGVIDLTFSDSSEARFYSQE